MLEDANNSMAEYRAMSRAEAQDLRDILASFESIFKVRTGSIYLLVSSVNLTVSI